MRKLKLTIDDTFETLGTALIPSILKLTEAITPVVEKISGWIVKHPELAANMTLVATGIAGLITALGSIGVIMPAISTGFTIL